MKKKSPKVTPKAKPKATKKKKATKKPTTVTESKLAAPLDDLSHIGRQPREFFVERYGENHFRIVDNIGFVYSNGRWVAVDVDGFNFTEREIGPCDPEFVAV